jgi:small subunit ribosomal protein S17
MYHKYISTKKRYKAHDEENKCSMGDKVLIVESRPISKEKRWLVKEIIKKVEPILVQEEVVKDDTGKN